MADVEKVKDLSICTAPEMISYLRPFATGFAAMGCRWFFVDVIFDHSRIYPQTPLSSNQYLSQHASASTSSKYKCFESIKQAILVFYELRYTLDQRPLPLT
jgi:hypothetical protein